MSASVMAPAAIIVSVSSVSIIRPISARTCFSLRHNRTWLPKLGVAAAEPCSACSRKSPRTSAEHCYVWSERL